MSTPHPAIRAAKALLAEVTDLVAERDELHAENAQLRAELADAYDGHGVQLAATDEEA